MIIRLHNKRRRRPKFRRIRGVLVSIKIFVDGSWRDLAGKKEMP